MEFLRKQLSFAVLFLPLFVVGASSIAYAQQTVVLRSAERLVRADSLLRRIWPGFWSDGPLVALAPFENGSLVLHGEKVSLGKSSRLRDGLVRGALPNRVSVDSDSGPDGPYNLFAEIGGQPMVSVRAWGTFAPYRENSEEINWASDSVASMIVTAIHESFHSYQWNHFSPLPGQMFALANTLPTKSHHSWLDSSWVIESLAQERATLSAALAQTSCEDAFERLSLYVVARESRLRRMPPPFRAYEEAHERGEGLANWIGYVGLQRAAPDLLADAEAVAKHDLRRAYLGRDGLPYKGWEAFASYHLYVVGAGKASLLARCGTPLWRERVTNGEDLQSILLKR